MYELTVELCFSAAHRLRDYEGPCARLHGHNYRVQVTVAGAELDAHGMLMDFGQLKQVCAAVIEQLDHQCLNELPPFAQVNPTSENLARHIYGGVCGGLGAEGVRIRSVSIWESDSSVATYREGD